MLTPAGTEIAPSYLFALRRPFRPAGKRHYGEPLQSYYQTNYNYPHKNPVRIEYIHGIRFYHGGVQKSWDS